ncbi:MAG: alkaline phosphatase family protein [Gammaproteobacteria bacterium]|nr:MAG: alkaline phosphatase family protein [Gammaproteobacteria bacterium]
MNVLFITADQWRGDCLSACAHACLRTPNLDTLAADGVLFRRHYAQATPCAPARASLYTGMYLHNHRVVVNGTPLDARHTNVALEVRKAGYHPALLGYTDTGADPRRHPPGDPALRSYGGVLPGMMPVIWSEQHWLAWFADLKAKGYRIPAKFLEIFRPREEIVDPRAGAAGRGLTFPPARFSAEDSQQAFLTGEAIKYLSMRGRKPWFLHISYLAPHPPFVAPAPYHDMYASADVPRPVRAASVETEAAQHPFLAHYLHNQRGWGIHYDHDSRNNLALSDEDILQARATYYGMASEVDAQIGRLLDHLRASGSYDDTLVVFTSDHGEQLGDHWQFAKYTYFDQSFHIPLIVRDPRPPADATRGRQVDAFTENVDIMPTILDCLGLDLPAQCDGESLLPFCHDLQPGRWRDAAHWEFDFRDFIADGEDRFLGLAPDRCNMSVMRDQRYKYVHFAGLPPLLFDFQEDPQELRDLAGDAGHRSLLLEYTRRMLSWRMTHDERVLANTHLTADGVRITKPPRY